MPQQNTQAPGFFLENALKQSIGGRKPSIETGTATEVPQEIQKPMSVESSYDPSFMNPLDVQIGGTHYKDMAIQPIEFIHANKLGFCEGNAIKYICRYKDKGGVQDLEKAIHYLQLLIEQVSVNG
jgi:hypothetical protein